MPSGMITEILRSAQNDVGAADAKKKRRRSAHARLLRCRHVAGFKCRLKWPFCAMRLGTPPMRSDE